MSYHSGDRDHEETLDSIKGNFELFPHKGYNSNNPEHLELLSIYKKNDGLFPTPPPPVYKPLTFGERIFMVFAGLAGMVFIICGVLLAIYLLYIWRIQPIRRRK